MDVIKSVITIQTIMSVRLFFGFYSTISSNKLVNVLVRVYCVVIATILILLQNIVISYYPLVAKLRFGFIGTLYTINVFISLLFSAENLFDFLNKIRKLTPRLKVNEEIPLSRILLIFLLLARLTSHFLYGILRLNQLNVSVESMLALTFDMAEQTSNFTRIIMFELLWHRMSILRKQLDEDLSVARRFEEGEEVMKKKLRSCMNSYKNLLNTTHETDAPMKFMVLSSMVLVMSRTMTTIYTFISYKIDYYTTCVILYEALLEITVTLTPAVLAEMVNVEIDKMKLCVVKQLLGCRGNTTRDVVDDAMVYFRHHPFKYSIWRLFTVDVSMILSAVGLLTTYTVAMVQFAHFYD